VNSYPPHAAQTEPLSHTVMLTLEEAALGKVESVRIPRADICPACAGTGQSWRDDDGTCSTCHNKGAFNYEKVFEVRIPAGVETGSRLRIAGEGNLGASQAERGDLYINIKVREHSLFERQGIHLHTFVQLTEHELTNGTEAIVPTLLDGRKQLRIPAGTAGDTIFRLAGLGVCSLESSERGDLFVRVGTQARQAPRQAAPQAAWQASGQATNGASFFNTPSTQNSTNGWWFLKHPKGIVVAAGLLGLVALVAFNNYRGRVSPRKPEVNANFSPSPSVDPTARYSPTPEPSPARPPFSLLNGANITPPKGPRGDNSMTIINGGYYDIALKLVSSSTQKTRRFIYVRANSTAVMKNLAREVCVLRWESGSDWDVEARRFLTSRSLNQFDKDFDLRKIRYTVSFDPSPTGTLRRTPIDESEFEDK
jgi:hypothetical protein